MTTIVEEDSLAMEAKSPEPATQAIAPAATTEGEGEEEEEEEDPSASPSSTVPLITVLAGRAGGGV